MFKKLFTQYAANVSGIFYNCGNFLQLILGTATLSPLEITSAVTNITAATVQSAFGHRNRGVSLAYILGFVGVTLAVYPSLVNLETGTIIGLVFFAITQLLCIFSAPLTQKYLPNKNMFLRNALGYPRRTAGVASLLLSRLPIIYESAMHQRWKIAAVFIMWALGDLFISFSKPALK